MYSIVSCILYTFNTFNRIYIQYTQLLKKVTDILLMGTVDETAAAFAKLGRPLSAYIYHTMSYYIICIILYLICYVR